MKKFWDRLGGAVAIIMTLIFAVLVANQIFGFISSIYVLKILNEAIYYGGIALVILVTMEMIVNANFIIKLVFVFIWVAIIAYSISPTFFGLLK